MTEKKQEMPLQTQEQRNKYVLGCLISWLAQSNGGISINDATNLLNALEGDGEAMTKRKRDEYYWVKQYGCWNVAFFNGIGDWYVTGEREAQDESDFDEIGPRILPPEGQEDE